MYPVCLQLGPLTVHWYGVMMALGFLAAFVSLHVLGRRDGRSFETLSDLTFWIMVGGIIGARVAYVTSEWGHFAMHPAEIIRVDRGGLIYYGGFLAAGVVLLVFARMHRERFWSLVDFVLASVPLAHAFGRVGCFLNGCCYGKATAGAMGVQYPLDSPAWCDELNAGLVSRYHAKSLAVHPVQLYEAGFDLALYALLFTVYRSRDRRVGMTSGLYFILYPVGRFTLEFLRGDDRLRWFGLSVAQWISIALLTLGCWLLARASRGGAGASGR